MVGAVQNVVPHRYLIKASTKSYNDISTPTDGIPETGTKLIKNVTIGVQTVILDNLTGETDYYIQKI